MANKEIVTMPCDPRWDPWVLNEDSQLRITSNVGPWGTNCLGLTSEPGSVSSVSNIGLPLSIDEELVLQITAIQDPTLDENGVPKENYPSEVVIVSGSASGVRKGDKIKCRFKSYFYRDPNEGEEVDPENLTDDGKVIESEVTIKLELAIESMTYEAIGPFPRVDVKGVNNMFWENHAMDCKASGDGESLRRLGSREPDANWLIDSPKNKWDSYCGWEHLFTGDTPNLDGRQSGKHPSKGSCLQLATNNMISRDQGILLGNWKAHQTKETARWMNPTGVQFEWTTRNTDRANASGIRLSSLWLIYKEAKDGVARYAPIYDKGMGGAQGEYIWERNDIGAQYHKRDVYGRFRGSLSAEDIVQVNERDAVCIAMLLMFNNAGQGANYYNIIDIYNFTFLFYNASGTIDEFTGLPVTSDTPKLPTSSRVIVPAPFPMREWDSGYFPIF